MKINKATGGGGGGGSILCMQRITHSEHHSPKFKVALRPQRP